VSVVALVVIFWVLARMVRLLRSGWAALRRRWSAA
jgi:hypothetical protein